MSIKKLMILKSLTTTTGKNQNPLTWKPGNGLKNRALAHLIHLEQPLQIFW